MFNYLFKQYNNFNNIITHFFDFVFNIDDFDFVTSNVFFQFFFFISKKLFYSFFIKRNKKNFDVIDVLL